MRRRDLRAIVFWAAGNVVLLVGSFLAFRNPLATLALVCGWNAWLLTRPRAHRIIRRLRGDPDWSGYFKND
ncbi:hypothetical protein [Phenylobacterium sp.]|jgi:hypothetical protein|uniref:hypothetical protein n=1 Tax=Phenylobacterium sp. TaxID=1871053 RepID=UPI003784F1F1